MEIQQPQKKGYSCCSSITLIIGLVFLSVIGFFGYRIYETTQSIKSMPRVVAPGQQELEEAEKKITRHDGQSAFGNTEEAEKMAATFSKQMEAMRKGLFSGGKEGAFSLTDGKFLTYCNLLDRKCVFIVHVPQLRKFTTKAQESLTELAWYSANGILKKANYPESTSLAVGVKGVVSYGGIYTGQLDGEEIPLSGVKVKTKGFSERKILRTYFHNNPDARQPIDSPKNKKVSGVKETEASNTVNSNVENTSKAGVKNEKLNVSE